MFPRKRKKKTEKTKNRRPGTGISLPMQKAADTAAGKKPRGKHFSSQKETLRTAPENRKLRKSAPPGLRRRKKPEAAAAKKGAILPPPEKKPRIPGKTYLNYDALELPRSYGGDSIVLIARDPRSIYCYWDISLRSPADRYTVTLYKSEKDIDGIEGLPVHRETALLENQSSCYMETDGRFPFYRAVIKKAGRPVALSNTVMRPIASPAEQQEGGWKTAEEISRHFHRLLARENIVKKPEPAETVFPAFRQPEAAAAAGKPAAPVSAAASDRVKDEKNRWKKAFRQNWVPPENAGPSSAEKSNSSSAAQPEKAVFAFSKPRQDAAEKPAAPSRQAEKEKSTQERRFPASERLYRHLEKSRQENAPVFFSDFRP